MILRYFVFILMSLVLFSCQNEAVKENTGVGSSIDSINPNYSKVIFTQKDTLQDDLARYLSGLPPLHTSAYSELSKEAFWKTYAQKMDKNWFLLQDERIDAIEKWDTTFLRQHVIDSLPLVYPFSGPDFLHAYYLFPRTNTYVLMALEPLSSLPILEKLNRDSRKVYFNSIENSLRDIFSKSYFITTHMGSDLQHEKVKGVLPLLYFFISRSGLEIRQTEQLALDTSGVMVKSTWTGSSKKVRCVKIIVRDPKTETEKTIYYISCNLSNTGLNFNPEVMKFVKKLGPCNTFIKAASYMPHYSTFKTLRDRLIDQSQLVLQDDTGFPYKYFKNKKKYDVILFGKYAQPVKDFGNYVFQKDLDSVYRKDSSKVLQLDFHLGYHWGDKKQAILLIRKK